MSNSPNDSLSAQDSSLAAFVMSGNLSDALNARGTYEVECRDAEGRLKWSDTIKNLVTDLGARLLLDTILGNSAGGAVIMGLKGTGTAVVGDTQASHAGWSEVGLANSPTYSAPRKSPSFSAASGTGAGSRSKVTSSAVAFTFTNSGTVAGIFLNLGGTTTIDNTTGTLFAAGDFSGGSRSVQNTDVVNVTYTLSI